jgi:hypothetical protein
MTRAILRSFGVAALTLVVGGAGELVYITALCPAHRVWQRVREGRTAVVLDSGYRYARADEGIYVCTVPHTIGPVVIHQDLSCYCASADAGAAALSRTLNGSCTVDHLHALRTDNTGACRHAHCLDPVRPALFTP